MMKRLIWIICALMLLCACAAAEQLPQEGPAPYAPVASAYSEDGLSYDDGTLSIRIESGLYNDRVPIYFVYVKLTDVSQLRTALAAPYPAKTTRTVNLMAQENNAVLALNGDYFTYHNMGIVVRSGKALRERPEKIRDTLVIDDNGDMVILTQNTAQEWNDYKDSGRGYREAFCFGPGLIIDGEIVQCNYRDKISCGAPTPAGRLVMCQTGPLEYMFFVCEEQKELKIGMTMAEVVELLHGMGVQTAYNLDGGNSATIWFGGRRVNAAEYPLRPVSDSIYFATLVSGN